MEDPDPKKGRISENFRFGYRILISEDFQLSANFTRQARAIKSAVKSSVEKAVVNGEACSTYRIRGGSIREVLESQLRKSN